MDDLDLRIINHLQADGRTPYTRLAHELAVSEGTIRRRVAQLLDDKIIVVAAVVDPAKRGLHTAVIVGIQVDLVYVESVARELTALPETQHVIVTTGGYDVFAWVHLPNPEALSAFLQRTIGRFQGVRHTESFVVLKSFR